MLYSIYVLSSIPHPPGLRTRFFTYTFYNAILTIKSSSSVHILHFLPKPLRVGCEQSSNSSSLIHVHITAHLYLLSVQSFLARKAVHSYNFLVTCLGLRGPSNVCAPCRFFLSFNNQKLHPYRAPVWCNKETKW